MYNFFNGNNTKKEQKLKISKQVEVFTKPGKVAKNQNQMAQNEHLLTFPLRRTMVSHS